MIHEIENTNFFQKTNTKTNNVVVTVIFAGQLHMITMKNM